VNIHASPGRDGKDRGRKNLAIGYGCKNVTRQRFQSFQGGRISNLLWLEDGKVLGYGQRFDGGEGKSQSAAPGTIWLGHHGSDFMGRRQKSFQGRAGKLRGSKEDHLQSFLPSSLSL
jgi:hypothetical protein